MSIFKAFLAALVGLLALTLIPVHGATQFYIERSPDGAPIGAWRDVPSTTELFWTGIAVFVATAIFARIFVWKK